MKAKALLKPHLLHAASVIAAKHDIRFYLNGVHVEVGEQETIYVGCDGHKLLVLRDPRTKQEPQVPITLTVPNETIAITPKKFKVPTMGVELHYDTEAVGGEYRLGDVFFKALDGKFPNWRTVVPKTVSGERSTLNPAYMMHFAKAAAIALQQDARNSIPEFWPNGEGGCLVLVAHYEDFVGVVMPLRDTSRGECPKWVKPDEPAPAPQAVEPSAPVVVEPANTEPAMAAAD